MSFDFGGEIAWRPTLDQIEQCRLTAFIRQHGLRDYDALMIRSIDDPEWFWRAVLDEIGVRFSTPYERILDDSAGIAWPRWCVGGRLNIVTSCLDRWLGTEVEHRQALVCEDENGDVQSLTYGELAREVTRCASGLRALGASAGDRVALFMPMCPELVIAFFAP
jgi:acetyl-CoA synthetase